MYVAYIAPEQGTPELRLYIRDPSHRRGANNMQLASRWVATDQTIPIMKPLLPTVDKLIPYLQRIDEGRYYTNFGPLLREFEMRLAMHFKVSPRQLAVVANGTVALSAALLAVRAQPGKRCLLPAWTFVASAAAVWAANLVPHFADVSPQTWMLDHEALRRRPDIRDFGAVMVVSAFGAPICTTDWDDFTAETGVPVIIDGAAAFDTVTSVRTAGVGKSPIMISLHATKVFGAGEGAVVLSTDESLIHRLRQTCNFGIWGLPEGQILGYNGKLSEYHAAVGLATLDTWAERRALLTALTRKYVDALASIPSVDMVPAYGLGWISCYCNVALAGKNIAVMDKLQYMGIETRRWWGSGVHTQSAYAGFSRDDLPVTDSLGGRVIGLPYFHDITDAEIERVIQCLQGTLLL